MGGARRKRTAMRKNCTKQKKNLSSSDTMHRQRSKKREKK